jgi:hypothetical protein
MDVGLFNSETTQIFSEVSLGKLFLKTHDLMEPYSIAKEHLKVVCFNLDGGQYPFFNFIG